MTLQCPMACPGLATLTLAGLCALWLPSAASSCGNLHTPAKPPTNHLPSPAAAPSASPTTPALRCRDYIWPCSAPWYAQGWPLTHWQGSVGNGCQLLPPPLEISTHRQNRNPHKTTCPALPQPPVQAPTDLLHTSEVAFDLAVPHGMPRASYSHTGRAQCAMSAECCLLLLWKSPHTGKTAPPTYHLPSPAAAPSSADPTTSSAHCRGCI